jgi:hypothetical protein
MTSQPVPQVSQADIDRVVLRDFPAADRAAAMAALEEYGTESHEPESVRVRLAALKLAGGSLAELRRQVSWAKMDYRDVIAPAEYPRAMKVLTLLELEEAERQRIYDADWKQYDEWLRAAASGRRVSSP